MATGQLYDPNAKAKKPVPGPFGGPPTPDMTTNPMPSPFGKPDEVKPPGPAPVGGGQPYDGGYQGPGMTTNGIPSVPNDPKLPGGTQPPTGPYSGPGMTTNAPPLGAQPTTVTTSPIGVDYAAPTAQPATAAPTNGAPAGMADPFAAMGGGQYVNGGWIPNNNPDAIAAARAQAATAPGGVPGATGPAATTNAPGSPATVDSTFKDKLLEMMGQSPTVSETDSSVAPQLAQNRIGQQRSFERRRAMAAERSAATGGGQIGEGELDTLASARGDAESAGAAGIMGGANQQRRAELMQALTLGGQYLDAQQKNQITQQLAQLDAQIKREGIASQQGLGQGDLALRGRLGDMSGNLSLLGLLSGNQQFGQQLSSNNAQFGANLNQNALLHMLGLA